MSYVFLCAFKSPRILMENDDEYRALHKREENESKFSEATQSEPRCRKKRRLRGRERERQRKRTEILWWSQWKMQICRFFPSLSLPLSLSLNISNIILSFPIQCKWTTTGSLFSSFLSKLNSLNDGIWCAHKIDRQILSKAPITTETTLSALYARIAIR